MRATMREPILNKTSAFTADPNFRHIVGQRIRRFRCARRWTPAIGSSRISTRVAWASRRSRSRACSSRFSRMRSSPRTPVALLASTATKYRTLVAAEAMTSRPCSSEARKFARGGRRPPISSSTNTPQRCARHCSRSALTSSFSFQAPMPTPVSQTLDGGKPLAERLKNLPNQHFIVKTGSDRWVEACVPRVEEPKVDYTDLWTRTRYERGRVRAHIERDIAQRQQALRHNAEENLS